MSYMQLGFLFVAAGIAVLITLSTVAGIIMVVGGLLIVARAALGKEPKGRS